MLELLFARLLTPLGVTTKAQLDGIVVA